MTAVLLERIVLRDEDAAMLALHHLAGQFPVPGWLARLQPQAFDDHDDHRQYDEDQECAH